ncbi:MAG: bifunctional DNA primase/polymerase, partial [Thermoleophilia bacterium]|nr:bifunctional DNA primase/polymerase [Thermoleophilia bacterium]
GGGVHYFYQHPGGQVANAVKFLPGLDIRADGGYVVAPPSLHASGRRYEWASGLSPNEVELAPCPSWLIEVIRSEPGHQATKPGTPAVEWRRLVREGVTEGYRNTAIARLVGHLLRRRIDPFVALDLALAWNMACCKPPLPASEVIKVADSIAGRELRRRRGSYK